MPRLFFGIAIPDDLRARIESVAQELRRTGVRASWVPPQNYHFTMKFLGEIHQSEIEALGESAAALAAETPSFPVAVVGAGGFPNLRKPRVLWVGGRTESGSPAALATGLDELGRRHGVKSEGRPFRLHLTVARVRADQRAPKELVSILERLSEEPLGSFDANELTLFSSELGRGPARYTPLRRCSLA